MRRILLAFGILFAVFPGAFAGQIQVDGKWMYFNEILEPGGPVETFERSGMPGYRGKPSKLSELPVRILMLPGDRLYGSGHLTNRFWKLIDPTLVVKNANGWSGRNYLVTQTLIPEVKTPDGTYALKLNLYGPKEKVVPMFETLGDAASGENEDWHNRQCLELRGHLTWSGRLSRTDPEKSEWTYDFRVASVKVVGKIPRGFLHNAPPVPNVEEATQLCSPEK